MGEVEDAALSVPDVFATAFHSHARLGRGDAWGEVDVVGDEQGLARREAHNETLVLVADGIIGKNAVDFPGKIRLEFGSLLGPCLAENLVTLRKRGRGGVREKHRQ